MRTAEGATAAPRQAPPRPDAGESRGSRRLIWPALAVVLLVGLGLRLWGIDEGLPYVYNIDELGHFVPHAVAMFAEGTLNPHYFANPPAFTYVLHFVFWVAYGGGDAVVREYALHQAAVFELARIVAAVLGTLALWLLYLTGARLFGRGVGLLAAALEAVAFLPVVYGHLALNDVPTLAPLSASLLGSAGILRKGRARDYALAGAGLGLACASKYTAGIVLVPLLAAAALRWRDSGERARARALAGGLLLAGVLALLAFLIANPFSVLDYSEFHRQLAHQSALSAEGQGKLGAPKEPAIVYYLWSLTWGLGWLPALAALGGALCVWRRDARAGLLLVPAAVAFLVFMGLEGRFFGRWLLPIFPLVCLLAALLAALVIERGARLLLGLLPARGRRPRLAAAALGSVLVAALLAQGAVYSVHAGLVSSREDTRASVRSWMLAHIPRGSPIVAEPVSFGEWDREGLPGRPYREDPVIWNKYASLVRRVNARGEVAGKPKVVGIEDYETTLAPALLGYYTAHGYCWVLTASTESGRAYADPRAVPHAIAYYKALEREGTLLHTASPYGAGEAPVAFNFDWSFDYYPLAYARPGPLMRVYRLHGGRCGR